MSGAAKDFFNFQNLKYTLITRAPLLLLGEKAQFMMAPEGRKLISEDQLSTVNSRESAVMLFLFENKDGQTSIYFILRKIYHGIHSGQIGFPGGKKENDDIDLLNAAIREAEEEIGIKKENYTVVQQLSPLYIPVSNFMVYPFLSIIHADFDALIDPREVEALIELPLASFFDTRHMNKKKMKLSNEKEIEIPYYDIQELTIWGASAMIMSELVEMLKVLIKDSAQ